MKSDVFMKYGTLGLDSSRKDLELDMDSADYGTALRSETIPDLCKK